MKILHIIYSLDQHSAALKYIRKQKDSGHEVWILSKRGFALFEEGVVDAIKSPAFYLLCLLLNRLDSLISGFVTSGKVVECSLSLLSMPMPSEIKSVKWDEVHVHWIARGFVSLAAIVASFESKIVLYGHDQWVLKRPVFFQIHEKNLNVIGHWFARYCQERLKESISASNLEFYVFSNQHRDMIREHFPCVVITKVSNKLDRDLFSPNAEPLFDVDPNTMNYLFVLSSSDLKRKGWDVVCDALEWLATTTNRKFRLIVIGSGVQLSGNESFDVHVIGRLEYSQMPRVYVLSDYTIVWSQYETYCQVAAESLNCGTPIISHSTLPCADYCDAEYSLISHSNSYEALCELLLKSSAKRKDMPRLFWMPD